MQDNSFVSKVVICGLLVLFGFIHLLCERKYFNLDARFISFSYNSDRNTFRYNYPLPQCKYLIILISAIYVLFAEWCLLDVECWHMLLFVACCTLLVGCCVLGVE